MKYRVLLGVFLCTIGNALAQSSGWTYIKSVQGVSVSWRWRKELKDQFIHELKFQNSNSYDVEVSFKPQWGCSGAMQSSPGQMLIIKANSTKAGQDHGLFDYPCDIGGTSNKIASTGGFTDLSVKRADWRELEALEREKKIEDERRRKQKLEEEKLTENQRLSRELELKKIERDAQQLEQQRKETERIEKQIAADQQIAEQQRIASEARLARQEQEIVSAERSREAHQQLLRDNEFTKNSLSGNLSRIAEELSSDAKKYNANDAGQRALELSLRDNQGISLDDLSNSLAATLDQSGKNNTWTDSATDHAISKIAETEEEARDLKAALDYVKSHDFESEPDKSLGKEIISLKETSKELLQPKGAVIDHLFEEIPDSKAKRIDHGNSNFILPKPASHAGYVSVNPSTNPALIKPAPQMSPGESEKMKRKFEGYLITMKMTRQKPDPKKTREMLLLDHKNLTSTDSWKRKTAHLHISEANSFGWWILTGDLKLK